MANDPLRVKIVGDTTDIERAIARVEQRLDRLAVTAGRVKTELAGALNPPTGGAAGATARPAAYGAPVGHASPAAGHAATAPSVPPPSRPATAAIPARLLGATGMSALEMRTMNRTDIDAQATSAQREQSQAARRAVEARKALADAQAAEAHAARKAIGAEFTPRTSSGARNQIIAAAQAEAAAAKDRTAAAQRASETAKAESGAARRRLAAAREVQSYAARTAPRVDVATPAAPPQVSQRRAALRAVGGNLARGGAAAALPAVTEAIGAKPGSVVSGALTGAAAGAVAGPWGMAAGAVIGGGVTAAVQAFKGANAKRTEDAARDFAKRVTVSTEKATTAGFRGDTGKRLGRANATLEAGDKALRDWRAGERQIQSGSRTGIVRGQQMQRQAMTDAKAAGMDIKALDRGRSNAYKGAERASVGAFGDGLKAVKFTDSRALMDRFSSQFKGKSPGMQQAGANVMAELASGMEKSGRVPKGTVTKLLNSLGKQFNGLVPKVDGVAAKTAKSLARGLDDRKLSQSANRLLGNLKDQFDQLPRIAVRTVPGAAASLRASLTQLQRIAADRNAPKELRKQAEAQLPGLRKAYSSTLTRLAEQMGVSRRAAASWADSTSAAALKAGKGHVDIDTLRESVNRLKERLKASGDTADTAKQRYQDLGYSAREAQALIEAGKGPLTADFSTFTTPEWQKDKGKGKGKKSQKGRRGTVIGRFQDGGLVPALVSSGERIDYGGQSMIVPGERVAADNVAMMLPVGAQVFTDHGQQLLAAGASSEQALAQQVPHFNAGGKVRSAKIGYTVYDDPPPGAFGSLAGGYAELGTATRAGKGTGRGWLARALGLGGELPADTPLTVRINGRSITLRKRDRGYGQGGDGITSDSRFGLDVWRDSWGKLGLNRNSSGTASIALGRGVKGLSDAGGGRGSTTVVKTTDDLTGMSARNARRQAYRLSQPSVASAFGDAFDAVVAGQLDRRDRGSLLQDINAAARVNLERTKTTVAGRGGKGDKSAGSIGGSGSFRWPVVSRAVTSGFGSRTSPNGVGSTNHDGIDIGVPVGTPVYAAARGRVTRAGVNGGYGNYVELQHRAGITSFYGHLSKILTATGKTVGSGARIALSGNTGTSTGPHLHFGVHDGGSRIDPRSLLGNKFRRGGVARFGGGGEVPGTGKDAAASTGHTVRKAPAARSALKALFNAGTRDNSRVTDALDRLNVVLGNAEDLTVARLEALSDALRRAVASTRKKASPGGKRVTKAEEALTRRARGAMSLVEDELGVRAGGHAARAAEIGWTNTKYATFADLKKRKAGYEPDSREALGIDREVLNNTSATKTQQKSELQKALKIAKGRGKSGAATAKALEEQIDGIDEDLRDLAVQKVENTRAQITAAAQEVSAAAQDRLSKLSLAGQYADRSGSFAAQAGNLGARKAELESQLTQAQASGDEAWQSSVLSELSQVDSSIKAIPEQGVANANAALDFDAALAALTDDGGADDKAVLEKRRNVEQQAADDARARMASATNDADRLQAQSEATQHLTALKGIKDAIETGAQEKKDQEATLTDLIGQMVQNQQKIISGSAASRTAITAAIGAAAGGYIGQSVMRGSATPGYAGSGVRL